MTQKREKKRARETERVHPAPTPHLHTSGIALEYARTAPHPCKSTTETHRRGETSPHDTPTHCQPKGQSKHIYTQTVANPQGFLFRKLSCTRSARHDLHWSAGYRVRPELNKTRKFVIEQNEYHTFAESLQKLASLVSLLMTNSR